MIPVMYQIATTFHSDYGCTLARITTDIVTHPLAAAPLTCRTALCETPNEINLITFMIPDRKNSCIASTELSEPPPIHSASG